MLLIWETYSQENNCARVSFLIKVQASGVWIVAAIKKTNISS